MDQTTARNRKPYPPEVRQRVIARMDAGHTLQQIGREMGINKNTLTKWKRKAQRRLDRTRYRVVRKQVKELHPAYKLELWDYLNKELNKHGEAATE